MTIMQCPECHNTVSDSANICPNCGYPIQDYIHDQETEKRKKAEEWKHEKEIERLQQQINDIEFTCPPPRLKVCLKCGAPFFTSQNIDDQKFDTPICKCGFPGVEIDYPLLGRRSGLGADLYILRHEVIPRNIGDKNSREYQEYTSDLYRQIKHSEEYWKSKGKEDLKIEQIPPDPKDFGITPEKIRYDRQQSILELLKRNRSSDLKFFNMLNIISGVLAIPGFLLFIEATNNTDAAGGAVFFLAISISLFIFFGFHKSREMEKYDLQIELAEKNIQEYNRVMDAAIEAMKRKAEQSQPLLPRCPFCHSTDLAKITVTKKVGKAWMFGIVGALDDAGKTYKCNNCGGKF